MDTGLIGDPAIFGAKRALRERVLAEREGLSPEDVKAASRVVVAHLMAWPAFQTAAVVLTYMAFRNEIDLAPLLEQVPGKRRVLPRMVQHPTKELALHQYQPVGLRRYPYGMLEPDPAWQRASPENVDLALIPGVAFDRHGVRLGYGGGYFDRLLTRLPGLTVGITYAQFVREELPYGPNDRRVQHILTEAGWQERKGEAG